MQKNKGVASFKKKWVIAGILFLICSAVFLFFGISPAGAQNPNLGTNYVAPLNLPTADPRIAAVELVRLLITFLGIIAVVFVIYAGFLWMTSAGNEEKVARAKKTLINAVIGLAVILSAFLIVSFVISRMNESLTGGGGGGGGGRPPGLHGGLGASGNSVIESHYPGRNQKDVARNTPIVITFKEPMLVADLITGGNINASNVLIYKTTDGPSGPYITTLLGAVSPDLRTFIFTQVAPYIGSASEEVNYTVELTSAIHKANNDLAWPGAGGGYIWRFTTGTYIDTTPPRVTSIIPEPDVIEPRNVIIQINFNEAINPLSASGPSVDMPNIVVSDGSPIAGNFYISNEYRTVEYLTESACGTNSCGDTVYCLPGDSNISVLLRAASLIVSGEAGAVFMPAATPPYDGITDMVGNSLDGNKNSEAQGPETSAVGVASGQPPYNENSPDATTQGDDYIWTFATNNTINISAPVILSHNPSALGTNVGVTISPTATFDKIIMSASLIKNDPIGSGSVGLGTPNVGDMVFYWLRSSNSAGQTTVMIRHEDFVEGTDYTAEYNSGIKDKYQNCYNPAGGFDCTPTTVQPYCCDGVQQGGQCLP